MPEARAYYQLEALWSGLENLARQNRQGEDDSATAR